MTTTTTQTRLNPSQTPTRVRYGVLGFACSLAMITYLDRVCFGSAAAEIIKDLHLQSVADLKWTFTAFAFAYAVFEVPSGWLGDVFGPRKALIRIVLWWSLFTALTGMVGMSIAGYEFGLPIGGYTYGSLALLVVVRFLFGMGEAGAFPNITRALHNWFPFQERGFTQGMVWMSGRMMGGLTPLVWALLIAGISTTEILDSGEVVTKQLWAPLMHWRAAFWLFGGIGLIWCALFAWKFRNRPEERSDVNAAERALIHAGTLDSHADHSSVPWKRIMLSGNLWTLCTMYFCQSYGWYFNITYLPQFLEVQHGVSSTSFVGALYKGGPLWLGAFGCLAGGLLTDWFIRRTGNRRLGRRFMGIIGHSLCACCYLACIYTHSAFSFFLAISMAAFFSDLTMGSSWATCQDIGRRYAAIVAGCMNMIGNLGGAVAGYSTGYLLERALDQHAAKLGVAANSLPLAEKAIGLLPGYQLNFISFAVVYGIAVLCWLRVDSTKPVCPEAG